MFKLNTKHTQPAPIGAIHDLPEKQRARPEQSRAATFYREFFCRIDEQAFAVLYAQEPSRPNVPVNVLVGLEALKSGFGWSDEDMSSSCTTCKCARRWAIAGWAKASSSCGHCTTFGNG